MEIVLTVSCILICYLNTRKFPNIETVQHRQTAASPPGTDNRREKSERKRRQGIAGGISNPRKSMVVGDRL
jgi:hypothetical protein